MLVVCNGAAKSGSTWLYNILQKLVEFEWPDQRYLSHSNTKHPTILEMHLESYLNEASFETRDVISKNHYGKKVHRELLLSSPHTRILDMSRDTRDVIVSSYYDECRRNAYPGTFSDYYWQHGRLLVDALNRYHAVWSTPHAQILMTSYEALKNDFEDELERIAAFLGMEPDSAEIARIYTATNIKSLRESYKDDAQYNTRENPFFRKGEIGDWENHFDAKMIRDYNKIESGGIGKIDLVHLQGRVRKKLSKLLT